MKIRRLVMFFGFTELEIWKMAFNLKKKERVVHGISFFDNTGEVIRQFELVVL